MGKERERKRQREKEEGEERVKRERTEIKKIKSALRNPICLRASRPNSMQFQ